MDNKRILILSETPDSYSIKELIRAGEARGHEIEVIPPSELYIFVSKTKGRDRIYRKDKRVYKKAFDAIIPRIGGAMEYGSIIVRHLHQNMNILSTAGADGLETASDKMKTTQILSKAKIPVPATTIIKQPVDYKFITDLVGGLPCVAKLQRGSQGKTVFILESKLGGSTALQTMTSQKMQVILSEFIRTAEKDDNANDIRAYVVGDKISAAYKRYALTDDFRSNYSISGAGEKVELSEEQEKMCIAAARALNLDICGVDLMHSIDEDRDYIIEVNGNAGLKGIQTVTGHDVATDIIKWIEENLKTSGRKKDRVSVESFEATLNSIPAEIRQYIPQQKLKGVEAIDQWMSEQFKNL